MRAFDEAHPVAARAHDERVREGAVGPVANASQKVSVGDARRRDDHLGRREVVDREDLLDVVDPLLLRTVDLAARRGPELSLHLAAEATKSRGCQHRLPRAADADRKRDYRHRCEARAL